MVKFFLETLNMLYLKFLMKLEEFLFKKIRGKFTLKFIITRCNFIEIDCFEGGYNIRT